MADLAELIGTVIMEFFGDRWILMLLRLFRIDRLSARAYKVWETVFIVATVAMIFSFIIGVAMLFSKDTLNIGLCMTLIPAAITAMLLIVSKLFKPKN